MNFTKLKHLEYKIHNEIPMTKLMNLSINTMDDDFFTTKAPLDININDKGSAFGGSLSSIAIISSWCLVKIISDDLGFDDCDILVIKNESTFKKQVTKDIYCKCVVPTVDEINTLKEKLQNKNSASIKINASIVQEDDICMYYEGVYVIKKKES